MCEHGVTRPDVTLQLRSFSLRTQGVDGSQAGSKRGKDVKLEHSKVLSGA